ncbi:hypothetical protein [Chitinasiproducens palmae]|uniref:Uncharacterized protein n=1 Tax=Chitinasiproducens palmae TaxID=1770053 RepID=A0A1H2PQU8_9BURK|nr:hypothetical protein [Chitinasiproducens palmae]SDV49239.1 hypothetical protein SAMN05216551_107175 [Chitinasiproducens palmae]
MIRHDTPDVHVRISPEGMRRQEAAPTAQVIDLEPQRIKRFLEAENERNRKAHAARLLQEAYL